MENIKIVITLAPQNKFDELDVIGFLHEKGLVVEKTERDASQQSVQADLCLICGKNPPAIGKSTCLECVDWYRTSR